MKLRRTTTDRPDLTEIRQPTCYDARDPLRPWLAAQDDPDDYDDIQLARFMAKHGAGATYTVGHIAQAEPVPAPIRVKHVDPGFVSTQDLPDPAVIARWKTQQAKAEGRTHYAAGYAPPPKLSGDKWRERQAELLRERELARARQERLTAAAIEEQRRLTESRMEFAVHVLDLTTDRALITLLPAPQLVATTFRANEGEIRLQVDVPRWVEQQTITEMERSGLFVRRAPQEIT